MLSTSSLGLGNSSDSGFVIDLDLEALSENTFLVASFDTVFSIGVTLKV